MALACGSVAFASTGLDAPPARCDVTAVFKARKGEIDVSSYTNLKSWLAETTRIASFHEAGAAPGGDRKICMVVPSAEQVRPVYRSVSRLVDRTYSSIAPVKVENRFGGLYERKPSKSWGRAPNVPRNNGLPQRPPTDKWN